MSNPRVNVHIGADTSGLASGVNRAKSQLGDLRKSVAGIGASVGAAIAGAAMGAFGKDAIRAAADFERLKLSLDAVKAPDESVDSIVKLSEELAKLPALGLNDVVLAFVRLKSVGKTTEEASDIIKEFGNAVAASGGGIAQFEDALYALTQIISNGRVLGQDLNQLKGAIPGIGAAMQQAFGVSTVDGLSDADKEAGQFLSKIMAVMSTAPRVKGGLGNSMDNLAMSVEKAKAAVGGFLAIFAGPMMDRATGSLEKLAAKMEVVTGGSKLAIGLAPTIGRQIESNLRADPSKMGPLKSFLADGIRGITEMLSGVSQDAEAVSQSRKQKANLQSVTGLQAERSAIRDEITKSGLSPVVSSSLTAIGGGNSAFGGTVSPAVRLLQQQVKSLDNQIHELQEINRTIKDTSTMR